MTQMQNDKSEEQTATFWRTALRVIKPLFAAGLFLLVFFGVLVLPRMVRKSPADQDAALGLLFVSVIGFVLLTLVWAIVDRMAEKESAGLLTERPSRRSEQRTARAKEKEEEIIEREAQKILKAEALQDRIRQRAEEMRAEQHRGRGTVNPD